MRARLTDLGVRALKPADRQYKVWDEQTRGFGVLVGERAKSWFVMYGDKRTFKSLGRWPDTSLSDARRAAQGYLSTQPEPVASLAFPDALDRFLAQDHWRPRSKYVLENSLRFHFKWTKPLGKITHEDVATVLDAIKGQSARAHALKDIRTFFGWCVPRYLPHSPADGLKMPAYVPRQRVLDDDELRKVWLSTEGLGRYGKQVQCLILTGQRVNQIVSFQQNWLHSDMITFPASAMKGNREHTIPVGPMTLQRLHHLSIRSMQGKKKADLDEASGVTGWTLHDLRRVLASQWAALGVSLPTIEAYLAHRSGSFAGIVGVYQKYNWMPEMRDAVKKWEERLKSLLSASGRTGGS